MYTFATSFTERYRCVLCSASGATADASCKFMVTWIPVVRNISFTVTPHGSRSMTTRLPTLTGSHCRCWSLDARWLCNRAVRWSWMRASVMENAPQQGPPSSALSPGAMDNVDCEQGMIRLIPPRLCLHDGVIPGLIGASLIVRDGGGSLSNVWINDKTDGEDRREIRMIQPMLL